MPFYHPDEPNRAALATASTEPALGRGHPDVCRRPVLVQHPSE